MANYQDDVFSEKRDQDTIGHDAANASDRRLALKECITNQWVGRDVGKVERIDTNDWHGWAMWLYEGNGGGSPR